MTCSHRTPTRLVYQEVEVDPWGGTETQLVEVGGDSTCVDISIGAFRCTQCGEVGYYTGNWKSYYEDDRPCMGDDHPEANTELVRKSIKNKRK